MPPSDLVPGIPSDLDALLLSMLEMEPAERIGFVDDVALALGRLGASAPAVSGRAYLYRPRLAGRSRDLEALKRYLPQRLDLEGRLVFIRGESGVGKTRLVIELAEAARARGIYVILGECPPHGSVALQAFQGLLLALADRCRECGSAETARLFGVRLSLLRPYQTELDGLPGAGETSAPPSLPADDARRRVVEAIVATMEATANELPLLLLLDDVQWADDLSLEVLEMLARGDCLNRIRGTVVVVYRSDEAAPRLAALARGFVTLDLDRLPEDGVASMVGDMIAMSPPPPELVDVVARQSEGNPLFVAEYLRAAVEQGLLARDATGAFRQASVASDLGTPPGVLGIVEQRLASLSTAGLALVRAAAVFGRETETDLLPSIAGLAETEAIDATRELMTRHVLEEPRPGVMRFTHDQILRAAYERMAAAQRRELHERWAVYLSATERAEERTLARHWESAGRLVEARACYLEAARQERSRYALREARDLYHAYFRLLGNPSQESVEARIELGRDVLAILGEMNAAAEELGLARNEAGELGSPRLIAKADQALADVRYALGRLDEAERGYDEAQGICQAQGAGAEVGSALVGLARVEQQRGHGDEARALYARALQCCAEAPDLEATVLDNLGTLEAESGRLDHAEQTFARALALSRKGGRRRAEGVALSHLGVLAMNIGDAARARAYFEDAMAVHREVGDRRFEGITLTNLAILEHNLGLGQECEATLARALTIHRETGNRAFEAMALLLGARALEAQGELAKAEERVEAAIAISEGIDALQTAEAIELLVTLLRRRGGDLARATRLIEQAQTLVAPLGSTSTLASLACEAVHVALAKGKTGVEALRLAEERVAACPLAESAKRALESARQAQAEYEARRPPAIALGTAASRGRRRRRRGPEGHAER